MELSNLVGIEIIDVCAESKNVGDGELRDNRICGGALKEQENEAKTSQK